MSQSSALGAPEVFVNPPLQLVAFDLRTLGGGSGRDLDLLGSLAAALDDPGASQELTPGIHLVTGEESAPEVQAALFRMITSDRTVSVAAWRTALVVECTEFQSWGDFRGLLFRLVAAYLEHAQPDSVARIGLRFVDEAHVPGPITGPASWKPYVNPAYLGLTALLDAEVTELAGGLSATFNEHNRINVRYGTLNGRALNTDGPLRLRERPESPGFVLDTDSFYSPTEPTKLDVEGVLAVADSLQNCAETVFTQTFTDAARDVFRTEGVLA